MRLSVSYQKETCKPHLRAILAGRDVLQKGLVRRIGDGSSTRIYTDRWIPNHFEGRPITSDLNMPITWVAELMTPSGGWNEDLIKQTFVDVDAHAILSTPARGIGPDVWAWGPERHGMHLYSPLGVQSTL